MKNTLMRFLLMVVCLAGFGQERLKIGYFYLEPFIIEKAGALEPIGVSVDYWEKLIAPAMGVTIEWVGPLPIARMYQSLDKGLVDAVFIVVKNPDREKKYLFPAKPYGLGHASLWVLKGSPLQKLARVRQLYNWRIGFVEGSVINPFLANENITVENAGGEDYKKINFDKLFAGRLDAVYDHNEYTLAYEAAQLKIGDRVRVVFLPLEPSYYFTAFVKSDRGKMLLKRYDPANNAIPAGSVEKIIRRYTGP
jgi:polar amino acid transport system substrate-binding protein